MQVQEGNQPMKIKNSINLSLKAQEATDGIIKVKGYANTKSRDRMGDIIPSSAWSSKALENYVKNPVILAHHDMSRPVGKMINYNVTDDGLEIEAEIHEVADPKVFALVDAGLLKAFSIGFTIEDLDYESDTDTFIIKALELHEVSVVSVPANQDSLFSVSKSFTSTDEFNTFKKQYIQEEEITMDPKDIQALIAKELAASALAAKEEADAKAAKDAELSELTAAITQEVSKTFGEQITAAEKLNKELEERFASDKDTLTETVKGLKEEIATQAKDLAKVRRDGITGFPAAPADPEAKKALTKDKDDAVLLAKILKTKVSSTTFGKSVIAKAYGTDVSGIDISIPGDHTVDDGAWETEFNTNIYRDLRHELNIEPLLSAVNMNASQMRIPTLPDVDDAQFVAIDTIKNRRGAANGSAATTGTAVNGPQLNEVNLIAHKLTAKDYLGNEEQEDTILPILGLIRENLLRSMARRSDRALLLGGGTTAADPITGLTTYAAADGKDAVELSIGGGDKVTVQTLADVRRQLGIFGLNPSELLYIVSEKAYYDLLDDPDFRTMDLVGTDATIKTGVLRMANGTKILISHEYAQPADGVPMVTAVWTRPFLVGNLRTLTVKTDEDIELDMDKIVITRRFGMVQREAGTVATAIYVA